MTWPFPPVVQPASGGGPFSFYGSPGPTYISGRRYLSSVYTIGQGGAGLGTTSTRLYYMPIYIWEAHTFTGASMFNSGVGDNGDTLRLGLYTHSATNGPTSLVIDFGEITLTGAAAERVLSSSVSIGSPGWYWIAFHSNQALDVYPGVIAGQEISNAGRYPIAFQGFFGDFATPGISASQMIAAWYVDTAYGALASTAVAPTARTTPAPLVWLIG